MKKSTSLIALSVVVVVGAGCAVPTPDLHTNGKRHELKDFVPVADAGIKVDPQIIDVKKLADEKTFIARSNPYALKGEEAAFEKSQFAANVLQTNGGFYQAIYEEKVEPAEADTLLPVEPQPARRLVGIMRGDTVTALIDMNDGSGVKSIYPGMVIEPDKTWMVESIDDEKAVLVRVKRDKRPFAVVVRLSPNLQSGDTSGAPGGGQQGGGPGGNMMGPRRGSPSSAGGLK